MRIITKKPFVCLVAIILFLTNCTSEARKDPYIQFSIENNNYNKEPGNLVIGACWINIEASELRAPHTTVWLDRNMDEKAQDAFYPITEYYNDQFLTILPGGDSRKEIGPDKLDWVSKGNGCFEYTIHKAFRRISSWEDKGMCPFSSINIKGYGIYGENSRASGQNSFPCLPPALPNEITGNIVFDPTAEEHTNTPTQAPITQPPTILPTSTPTILPTSTPTLFSDCSQDGIIGTWTNEDKSFTFNSEGTGFARSTVFIGASSPFSYECANNEQLRISYMSWGSSQVTIVIYNVILSGNELTLISDDNGEILRLTKENQQEG